MEKNDCVLRLLDSWDEYTGAIKKLSYFFDNENENAQKNDSLFQAQIEGLKGTSVVFFIASYALYVKNKIFSALQYKSTGRYSKKKDFDSSFLDTIIIVPNTQTAAEVKMDLQTALNDSCEIYLLPNWGLVPYGFAAKGSDVFGKRAATLSRMLLKKRLTFSSKPRFFIITQRAFQSPFVNPEYIKSLSFSVYEGQIADPSELAEKLSSQGYTKVPRVAVTGEFTLRGEVLDVFVAGEENPYRILFDFDQISKIKTFSVETQATIKETDFVSIFPMKEVIWTSELIKKLETKFDSLIERSKNEQNPLFTENALKAKAKLIEELAIFSESEGEELFYSLLDDKVFSIFDYIEKNSAIFFVDFDRMNNSQESFEREYSAMYKRTKNDFPVLPPSKMLFDFTSELSEFEKYEHSKKIIFKTLNSDSEGDLDSSCERLKIECDDAKSFFGNFNYLKEQFADLKNNGWKITIFADNVNQSLRIKELLKDFIESEPGSEPFSKQIIILPAAISSGFSVPECKIIFIQENEIFGRRKRAPKSLSKTKSEAIDTFVDLNAGDFVVHVNYGIGIFKGIQRVKAGGNERDYIKLEYADEEFVFVPIEQVNLVQRYIGNEGNAPRIDKIGSKNWENRKNRVKKAVEDLAEKLITLYSRRKASRGFAFAKDTEWQTTFEAAFPYEDTPDQYTVTKEVKADMEKPVPMDRLICGDVGYGKTEIAMRAAFKAVMSGKQVAILSPTTILAEQHYETCEERFSKFPVKIAQLSRFVSQAEQKKILKQLENGAIDILIGTHRIIQKDVIFRDLGLLIIDEEQRFGVKDKEKLKAIKANIDCLSMSATPIPRTLHMSLLKIRDMSLLSTPPQTRKPIETIVDEYTDERVIKAIRRETERSGQVFYLHNRVESLEETRKKLERLLPEMLIECAHGQMSSDELDDVFRRFKNGGFHVLVSTTIIENGIDIPNVNTIIIDRADMYGVSQLYQLRGRVGRSDRKAYAYLLYPENKALSEVAMKRLQVISDFTELGSGFKIAMKDMEIRGAGNLLGRDQSGDVYSVGFDLYLKLLNEAVERLTASDFKAENEVYMELEYTGFIPDSYIPNLQTKMEVYKKIAAIQSKSELDGIYSEIEDRFGKIPDEVYSLLSLAEVRVIAKQLFIKSLKEKKGIINIEFSDTSNINIDKILRLIAESPSKVRLNSSHPDSLILETGKIGLKEKSEFIKEKLEQLL